MSGEELVKRAYDAYTEHVDARTPWDNLPPRLKGGWFKAVREVITELSKEPPA